MYTVLDMPEAKTRNEVRFFSRGLLALLLVLMFMPAASSECRAAGRATQFGRLYPMCQENSVKAAGSEVVKLFQEASLPETGRFVLPTLMIGLLAWTAAALIMKLPPQIVFRRRFLFWMRSGSGAFAGSVPARIPKMLPRGDDPAA